MTTRYNNIDVVFLMMRMFTVATPIEKATVVVTDGRLVFQKGCFFHSSAAASVCCGWKFPGLII
jgi:hypothetical protein